MRKQLEELKHLWPLACAIIGVCLVESNLAFIPWKVLGLILAFAATVRVIVPMWRTGKKEKLGGETN